MTPKSRFELLQKYITDDDVEVEIDESYYDYAKIPHHQRIINGSAGVDSHIILYKDSKDTNYNMLSSMLIHEYGHVIKWRENDDKNHTEKSAWIAGINSIPIQLRPPTLKEDVILCLKTYDYKNFSWLSSI